LVRDTGSWAAMRKPTNPFRDFFALSAVIQMSIIQMMSR
jgi:hypothetical protein